MKKIFVVGIGILSLFLIAAAVNLLVPVEQAKLTASDSMANDRFGSAIDVRKDTIFVGVPEKWGGPFYAGAVYVSKGKDRLGPKWLS